jgi:hypothetical protein
MAGAFDQIWANWGISNISAAAGKFVAASQTALGAVNTVQSLIQEAGQPGGITAAEGINAFAGALVAIGAASGAVSLGIGALITTGVAVAVQALSAIGVLPSPGGAQPQVCGQGFPHFPPSYVLGCMGFQLNPSGPYGQHTAPWVPFPEPTDLTTYRNDPGTAYNGGASNPWFQVYNRVNNNYAERAVPFARFASNFGPRLVDAAWPQYRHLECEQSFLLPGVPGDFQRAYFAAWKTNQNLALNGQRPATDAQVLAQLLTLWNGGPNPGNASHSNAQTFKFDNRGQAYMTAPGIGGDAVRNCADVQAFGPYVCYLVTALSATRGDLLANGTDLVINAGPAKSIPNYGAVSIGGSAAPPSTVGATVAKVAVVIGAAALAAVGIYAVKEKVSYLTAWQQFYDKAAGALRRL